MDVIIDVILYGIVPAAVFLISLTFVAFGLLRLRKRIHKVVPECPVTHRKMQTPHSLAPLFERLRAVGVEVWNQSASPSTVPFRVVLIIGHESVYRCSCCGQRGKYAVGETLGFDRGRSGSIWLGHVCGHCGFVDRYQGTNDGSGFFALTLEHGGTLLDVVTALESQEGKMLAHRIQGVLAERECVLMARTDALRALSRDIAAATSPASSHPFRGWGNHASFKA